MTPEKRIADLIDTIEKEGYRVMLFKSYGPNHHRIEVVLKDLDEQHFKQL